MILFPWTYERMPMRVDYKEQVLRYINNRVRYAQAMQKFRAGEIPESNVIEATEEIITDLFSWRARKRPGVMLLSSKNIQLLQLLAITVPVTYSFTVAGMIAKRGRTFFVPTCMTLNTARIHRSVFGEKEPYSTPTGIYFRRLYERAAETMFLFWEQADKYVPGAEKMSGIISHILEPKAMSGFVIFSMYESKYRSMTIETRKKQISVSMGGGADALLDVALIKKVG